MEVAVVHEEILLEFEEQRKEFRVTVMDHWLIQRGVTHSDSWMFWTDHLGAFQRGLDLEKEMKAKGRKPRSA